MRINAELIEFQWDTGNSGKNKKHEVEDIECEEVFFDEKKIIFEDKKHSKKEERFVLIGKTEKKRLLYIAFTMRKNKIRIISARDINKKEVFIYEKATE